ncbi:MAG: FlgD immunoglobulin-like domain containing protein [Salinivenus sp.]
MNGTSGITYHHNLFAHNYIRNPALGGEPDRLYDVRNNVVYGCGRGMTVSTPSKVNIVGNYFWSGRESYTHSVYIRNCEDIDPSQYGHVYFENNWGERIARGDDEFTEVRLWQYDPAPEDIHRADVPFDTPPVTTQDPHTAYDLVTGNAGANVPVRDPVDERVVTNVVNLLNTKAYPGDDDVRTLAAENWATLTYEDGTPPDDTDSDGMPDSWEIARDLDPNDPADSSGYDLDPDYTNVEVYINSLASTSPEGNLQPSADAGPDQNINTNDPDGADVELDGSASSDPDGDALTYEWTWQDADDEQQSASGINPTVRLPVGETVVTLVVNDGSLLSVPDTTTITINMDNQPPDAPDVGITPEQPNTTDQLTATAQATDPDGDEVTYSYAWYKDDVLQEDITGRTVDAELTSRGEAWHVVVTPSDGNLEGEIGQASVTIVNAPPTKPTVTFAPTSPKTGDDIVASAEGSTDPDGDDVTYEFAWYKDGGDEPPSPIVTGPTLSSDHTSSGETWRVVAIPSDGENTGEPDEAKVVIDTTGPTQPTVSIQPADPRTTDDLVASAEGSTDPDGGTVTYQYAWYRDGDLQTDLTDATVAAALTARGEQWRVVVTPDNGTATGPSNDASVTIRNSAPSAPTVTLSPTSPRTSDDLVVSVEGSTDPDGDDITHEYTWYKDGEVQSSLSGATVSSSLTAKEQTWRVVVRATDGTDSSPGVDASATIVNSKPTQPSVTISPDAPSSLDDLAAAVEGSTDADGDTITFEYEWYRNGTLQEALTGANVESDLTDVGETWRVVVTPHDGEAAGDSGEATATIDNSAPTKPTVSISPESPATDEDIVASASGSTDPDDDAITYVYSWQKDGVVQQDLTDATVPSEHTAKGETWEVSVTATDGQSTSPAAKANVTVVNTPPTAPTVAIEPETPVPGDDLVAQPSGSTDIDGDTVRYRYEWHRDGALQEDLTSATVSADLTAGGETWRVVATPTDGDATGPDADAAVTVERTYTISGTISDHAGDPVAGVEVSDGTRSVVTDTDGDYTIGGYVADTSVTLTASLSEHTVTPNKIRLRVPPTVTDADFTAHRVYTHAIGSGVQLVGSPIQSVTTSPSQVWGSSLVARWDPSQSRYVFLSDNDSATLGAAAPGRGYFIRSQGDELAVPGVPVADEPFALELESGWNMVANMFVERLPFANIADNLPEDVQPAGYAYDPAVGYIVVACVEGANIDRDCIEPWEGVWLYNAGEPTTVTVPPPGQSPAAVGVNAAADGTVDGLIVPRSAMRDSSGWTIPIHVETSSAADRATLVGVSSALDRPVEILAPPRAPESISARIVGRGGAALAQNVRTAGEPANWDFVVSTDLSEAEVDVRLPDLSSVPSDMAVYLTDLDADRRVYARTVSRYSYTTPEGASTRRFRLEVVPRTDANLAITSMSASQGRDAAGITFNVTSACDVSARVMNMAGRTVRVLTAGETMAEGTNTLSWNLRSDEGTAVASGVYIVMLEARSHDGQQTRAISTMSVRR